ncbi:hypothetical protein [Methanocella sp.]|uniref:hypothetical protein n=1 Tax=Methanocella sp. TaxID=2052833 RepID=UPI002D7F2D95|nr:hypothetical protein [Methanocella sp.]
MDNAAVDVVYTSDDQKRIDAMEKDLEVLKVSIKKLMIDIRDEMNNTKNPFVNLQQLQAPTAGIEVRDMSNAPAEPVDELDEPEELETPETLVMEKKETPVAKAKPVDPAPQVQATPPLADPVIEEMAERRDALMSEFEDAKILLKQMKEEIKEREAAVRSRDPARLDPETIIKLMQWTKSVVMKNGTARFYNLLDAYVSMGYLNPQTRAIIEKMCKLVCPEVEPIPKDIDIKECVGDMYALFLILNPRDKDMDSRMLAIMLGYEDRTLNIL